MFSFKNLIYNTYPLVLHSPGDYNQFPFLIEKSKKYSQKKKELSDDLTIFSWNNSKEKGILELLLDKMNIPYFVLGKGILDWKNKLKINLTINFLKTVKTKYVLAMDCFDVIILDNPNRILERFKLFYSDKKLIFNATAYIAPYIKASYDLFMKKHFKDRGPFCNINAGVWIGETEFCLKFFQKCLNYEKDINIKYKKVEHSEQLRVKLAFADNCNYIDIDSDCKIFQVLNNEKSIFENDNRIYFKIFDKIYL